MAERKETGFIDTVLKWAKWGAIGMLGLTSALLLGVPSLVINTLLSATTGGLLIGGAAGGIVGGLREVGKAMAPKQSKTT